MRLLLPLILFGCSHQVLGEGVRSGDDVVHLAVEEGCSGTAGDHVSVDGAELTSGRLLLRLRHGGGCEEHSYRLCPDPVILRTDPGIQRLVVVHDAGGDMCEAEFDILAEVALEDLPNEVLSLESLDGNVVNVSVR